MAALINFGERAAKLGWPDGARRLIGWDGMTVHIEPTIYKVDADTIRRIDEWTPPALNVWLPERSPDAIPKPGGGGEEKKSLLKRLTGFRNTQA